jgi:hypothetical protein
MKIILSRKGFDSESGGKPSPIFPDGTLLSLPIPQANDTEKYSNLFYGEKSYLELIHELNPQNNFTQDTTAHLDPDIRKDCRLQRAENWKPLFGQSGAAQGKLNNEKLINGDLFLFFGSFRQTEFSNGKLRFKKNSSEKHIIFGYLQIDQILKDRNNFPEYAKYHSHYSDRERINNCIYTCQENLTLIPDRPGAGTLRFSDKLVLTKDSYSKSRWSVPEFFKELTMTYHTQQSFKEGYFQSVGRGQEFVVQPDPRLTEWAKSILL